MKQLCSDSFILDKGKDKLCNFTWNALDAVIQSKAPILHSVLKSSISAYSNLDDQVVVGICASICLSNSSTLHAIDQLVLKRDEQVLEWRDNLLTFVSTSQVTAAFWWLLRPHRQN